MTSIKISIITVIFNAEKIIKKTIDSITSQKYKNVEIIIIDGASTDRTLENTGLVETNNIKILSESDNGIYDAMNKGLKLVKLFFELKMMLLCTV